MRTRSAGDIGKGWAVNVLLTDNGAAMDLDLSCKANGDYDEIEKKCTASPVYRRVDMRNLENDPEYGDGRPWFLFEDTTDAAFVEGNFDGVLFGLLPNVNDTKFVASTFVGSEWSSMIDKKKSVMIMNSDVSFAYIWDSDAINVFGSNISGTVFFDSYSSKREYSGSNWAWGDYPPKIYTAVGLQVVPDIESVKLCDPAVRTRGSQSERPLTPLGGTIKDDVTGIKPQVRDDYYRAQCKEITAGEARAKYPSSYELSGPR